MLEKILNKFKLGKHYKIERFGILMLTFVLLIGVDVTTIGYGYYQSHKEQLGSQVMYTTESVGSQTGSKLTVEGIYVSDDKTKCFLWLGVNAVDGSLFSWDVDDYSFELYGSDSRGSLGACNSSPAASLYVFGAIQHFGIYLVDANGFDNQIVDLVLKNNRPVDLDGNLDLFQIYFNPGGAAYTTLECLNKGDMTPYNLYYDIAVASREAKLKQTLESTLISMYNKLYDIETYTKWIIGSEITVPENPEIIRGDFSIVVFKTDDNMTTYGVMPDAFERTEDNLLYYDPPMTCAKGFNFNWRDGSVRDGYLEGLANGMTDVQYMEMIEGTTAPDFSTSDLHWYYTNTGAEFDTMNTSNLDGTSGINANIQHLVQSWRDYHALKESYQCDLLKQLLGLEVECKTSVMNCSVSAGSDLIYVYKG